VSRLDVIDVTVVGGPDVGARVASTSVAGGRRLDIELYATADDPALVHRVGVVLETEAIRDVVTHGWLGRSEARRGRIGERDCGGSPLAVLPAGTSGPGDVVSHQMIGTDSTTVGWIGTGRHAGVVVVRDGWLMTAWALLGGGLVLGPGETVAIDPLFLGTGSGGTLAHLAAAWARSTGAEVDPAGLPSTVWSAGASVEVTPAVLATLAGIGIEAVVLEPDGVDGAGIAATARDLGLRPGLRIDIGRTTASSMTGPAAGYRDRPDDDLTRPGTTARLRDLGATVAALGVDYVVVDGCSATLTGPRWGDASVTPTGALRLGLEALRTGLGAGVVLHLADSPLGVAPGVADVVETSPPGGPGGDLTRSAATSARRAPLHGRVWAAATAPLLPAEWSWADNEDAAKGLGVRSGAGAEVPEADMRSGAGAEVPEADMRSGDGADALDVLRATTSTIVLAGDPRSWTAAAVGAVRRITSATPRG
jgi:hypothetical protein